MGTSDITVTALAVTPGIGHNAVKVTVVDPRGGAVPNIALDVVEVYASATNDRGPDGGLLATKIDEGKDKAFHMALVEGSTHYYWGRPRNRLGNYGDWFPSGATSGVACTVGFAASAGQALINGKIVVSSAAGALTAAVKTLSGDNPSALNPVLVSFRSATLTDATPVFRQITSALSLTLPSTATGGFTANDPSRVWWSLFDVGDGTVDLAARNCSTSSKIFGMAEFGVASTTAVSTAADNAGVFYTNSALTSRPFRIAGYSEWSSGLATPGTWTDPTGNQRFGPGVPLPGAEVQSQPNSTSTMSTFVADFPFDNTIPQSGEGSEQFSTGITPASAVNLIENEALVFMSSNGANNLILALFRDAEADALRTAAKGTTGQEPNGVLLRDRRRAGSSAARTFKVRAGGAGGAATITINGVNATAYFGGTFESSHVVRELMG